MKKHLPLRALKIFEEASNHSSLSRAAVELCMTHGAISHQIRSLESWLGTKVFNRHREGVRLTEAGHRLNSTCKKAFSLLEEECYALKYEPKSIQLKIGCSTSFLMHWLLPKVEGFSKLHPEITLNFQTTDMIEDLKEDKIDVLILSSSERNLQGIKGVKISSDKIGPVCIPLLSKSLTCYSQINDKNLLHAKSMMTSWKDWSKKNNIKIELNEGKIFDSLSLSIEAAKRGLGVAIAPMHLVKEDIDNKNLVAPFGFIDAERETVLYSKNTSNRIEIKLFQQWLTNI